MLITPRIYSASQTPDRRPTTPNSTSRLSARPFAGWRDTNIDGTRPIEMLLIRQAGSVRVGEVIRYTLTYTPTADRIHPAPAELHIKVKNTSAVPLRAAYLHGPYTLYASCYPSTFDPNEKANQDNAEFIPQFEPYLKAGGSWNATIPVPEYLRGSREEPGSPSHTSGQSVTWVIEIISQIVFSSTASVNFELLVGYDEKSVELLATPGVPRATLYPKAAQLSEHWSYEAQGSQVSATKGVFSKAISLLVDDTSSLWNTPQFPSFDTCHSAGMADGGIHTANTSTFAGEGKASKAAQNRFRRKIHLVVLTHGLHSNLGADMLYLKECIDTACRKAKRTSSAKPSSDMKDASHNEGEDEEVIVRGFPGNAARTERGIQYLGKRLAKYVLLMTYPDQPYFPRKTAKPKRFSGPFAKNGTVEEDTQSHPPSIHPAEQDTNEFAYQIASISFIGHSLGGLVQTYAIAYIQKYSPDFFNRIKPINFIALATPFLGLSNENPLYVRFALDLGLVGRTGQDLGLSWTAPRMRSGWEALIGGKGDSIKPQGRAEAETKPLLRILPCGPAHEVLTKFKHRTVYSNLVNDGIVPLRTSCLLFLDWKGLDRVEKTRRENGLVGTMAGWTWAELTGANFNSPRTVRRATTDLGVLETTKTVDYAADKLSELAAPPCVPPACFIDGKTLNETKQSGRRDTLADSHESNDLLEPAANSPLTSLFSLFRPNELDVLNKHTKVFKRSQTLGRSTLESISQDISACDNGSSDDLGLHAPPKTTLLESASDLLIHPLPPLEFIMDPDSRPRTIFHDCVYYPEDIPAPVIKRKTSTFSFSQAQPSTFSISAEDTEDDSSKDDSGLKIEEKIARAYHRNLSWRKVLVRLEPDAHNNIIVRRMFTNAYGWPVVKHLIDTHFGNTSSENNYDAL